MTLDTLRQDFRYALRGLRAKPGFTVAIVVTLGLGLGVNAAMFGVVDRLLFRPPPLLRDAALTHRVFYGQISANGRPLAQDGGNRYKRYIDLAQWTSSFSMTAGHSLRSLAVGTGDAAREMKVGVVSASFFRFFDAPPALGRYFVEAEDQPPLGAPVAVISYATWRTRYGGNADVLGQHVQIGPTNYTIIGVAAKGFVGLWPDAPPVAFISISSYAGSVAFDRKPPWWQTYGWGWMGMIAQRKPGVSVAAADADLTQAMLQSWELQRLELPRSKPANLAKPRAFVQPILPERGVGASSVSKVATWIGGVSVLVLVIACANVANLLLARALRRRREIALRLALGVSRSRLIAQLLTESLVLALLGGAVGLLVAQWGSIALKHVLFNASEASTGMRDARTVLFTALATVCVGVLTGLAPIFQARRADLTSDLKSGQREGGGQRSRARSALLVAQCALSVLLVVGAGLFVRSLSRVQSVRLGYDVDPVMLVSIQMRGVQLDSVQSIALRETLRRTALGIPGVENASRQLSLPFYNTWNQQVFVDGMDSTTLLGQFDQNAVSSSYFATVGTRILRGRAIADQDVDGSTRVAVVSEAMGKALWPGKDPIGQCFRIDSRSEPCTYVVGIAENVHAHSFTNGEEMLYYMPSTQFHAANGGLLVRTRGQATQLAETVRRHLQRVMPGASYVTITPIADVLGDQTRSWQLGASMFTAFGALALVLAAVGLYSVIAYDVQQRTRELGVRVALGAQTPDVVRLVVSGALAVALVGVALGVGLALVGGRWLAPLLFQVSPRDPAVFGVVVLTLIVTSVGASWIPARRASRVDPNVALRAD